MLSPAEHLRDELAYYRDGDDFHRGGMSFGGAWSRAIRRVFPDATDPEREWTESKRDVWQRAYDRLPPAPEDVAFVALLEGVDRKLLFADLVCALPGCTKLVVKTDGRQARKVFCSSECQRLANRRREKAQRQAAA